MNSLKPMGLLASGRMNESTLLRVPQIGPAFGPIAASSKRLASRYANTLRMGWPADSLDAFAGCRLVWIQAPAAELAEWQLALLRSGVDWRGKTVVLLDRDLDSSALAPLAAQGACAASLTHAPLLREEILLGEGDQGALQSLRPLWKASRARVIELKPGQKPVLTAGIAAAEVLIAPVVDLALTCIRMAGVNQAAAKRLAGALVETAVREQFTHGRKSWTSPAAGTRREITMRQLAALRGADPAAAMCFQGVLAAALRWYGEPHNWLGPG